MNKKIEDYLPYYIGQKILVVKPSFAMMHNDCIHSGEIETLTPNLLSKILYATKVQVKPILRPLSDMTDEDANVVWEALGLNPDYEESMKRDGNNSATKSKYLQDYFFRKQVFGGHSERFDFRENIVLVYTLLKMGFDLFGLIEANLAVDKTKEVPNVN